MYCVEQLQPSVLGLKHESRFDASTEGRKHSARDAVLARTDPSPNLIPGAGQVTLYPRYQEGKGSATWFGRGATWRSDAMDSIMAMFAPECSMSGTGHVDGVGFCMTSFRLTPLAVQSQRLSGTHKVLFGRGQVGWISYVLDEDRRDNQCRLEIKTPLISQDTDGWTIFPFQRHMACTACDWLPSAVVNT